MIQAWALAPGGVTGLRPADWTLTLRSPNERVWLADRLQVWRLAASRIDADSLTLPWPAAQDGLVLWLAGDHAAAKTALRRLNRSCTPRGDAVWAALLQAMCN